MGVVEIWAKYLNETSFRDVPQAAIDMAVAHVADTVGAIMAGTAEPVGVLTRKFVKEMGGTPEAGVFGGGFKTNAPNAAFANGVAGHSMDYDDSWVIRGHPSVAVLPAVLALGEKMHASGKAVLEAYILGMEVMGRLALAINDRVLERGFHSTAIWGVIGACAATSKLLSLDVDQTRMALGNAASTAAGLHKNRGTMTKSFHAGQANRNGLVASLLAKEGFTADKDIMEGKTIFRVGWANIFTAKDDWDLSEATKDMKKWTLTEFKPGLVIKKYPCGFSLHWALDAAIWLVKNHKIDYRDVAAVEVGVKPAKDEYSNDTDVESRLKAKFSMQFVVASAIVDGGVSRHTFDEAKVDDPRIRDIMSKITLKEYPLPPEFPIVRHNPITITLKDGRKFTHKVDKPFGYPDVPIPNDMLMYKYRDCASVALSLRKVEESVKLIEGLVDLPDIAQLSQVVTGTPRRRPA